MAHLAFCLEVVAFTTVVSTEDREWLVADSADCARDIASGMVASVMIALDEDDLMGGLFINSKLILRRTMFVQLVAAHGTPGGRLTSMDCHYRPCGQVP